eukprot:1384701-Rhodomonas_salina.1
MLPLSDALSRSDEWIAVQRNSNKTSLNAMPVAAQLQPAPGGPNSLKLSGQNEPHNVTLDVTMSESLVNASHACFLYVRNEHLHNGRLTPNKFSRYSCSG